MKKDNVIKLVAVALVVAIISTGLFYGLFASRLSSEPTNGRTLVVAAKALKPGTTITQADVKAVPWATDTLPKESYQTSAEVIGNTVFDSIGENEPVLGSRLGSSRNGTGVGVPDGMRAISVHVADSTGVMNMLRSGQKVDVQVVTGRGTNRADTSVRTVLENITVLAVTPQVELSSQGQNTPVVTLLTKPQDADKLAAADSGANVRLLLRNPADQGTRARNQVTLGATMRATE